MRRGLLAGALLAGVFLAPLAHGDSRTRSATRDGMTLTVTPATGLEPAGRTVRVTGRGYDVNKGIYVAFCVDNGRGQAPTPCGGGQDEEGESGSSVWVSSFPPYYGTGLAKPYGEGGTFDVTIRVQAKLNDGVDCRTTRCAVVTRADHTASDDRSLDVAVPLTFTTAAGHPSPTTPARATPSPTPTLRPTAATRQVPSAVPTPSKGPVEATRLSGPTASASSSPTTGGGGGAVADVRDEEGSGAQAPLGLVAVGLIGAGVTTLVLRRRSSRR